MRLVIVIAVLEAAAIFVVVALCVVARRADARTERMLSREEREAHRRVDAPPRRVSTRWLRRLFGNGGR